MIPTTARFALATVRATPTLPNTSPADPLGGRREVQKEPVMRKPLLGALSLACFAMGHVLAFEAAPENVENIAIVLDCSRSMAEPMAADGSSENRLDAARGAVLQLLEDLSTTGQHRVTLCLFGH